MEAFPTFHMEKQMQNPNIMACWDCENENENCCR